VLGLAAELLDEALEPELELVLEPLLLGAISTTAGVVVVAGRVPDAASAAFPSRMLLTCTRFVGWMRDSRPCEAPSLLLSSGSSDKTCICPSAPPSGHPILLSLVPSSLLVRLLGTLLLLGLLP
jgi:hypothetical protein